MPGRVVHKVARDLSHQSLLQLAGDSRLQRVPRFRWCGILLATTEVITNNTYSPMSSMVGDFTTCDR